MARLVKWIPSSLLRLPRMEAVAGRANASQFFYVLKGASLRVACSGWPAVHVLFKIDNEKCRLLIDLYKDHCSLWDPKHNNYHNSTRREDSWKKISSI
jgi:hypothetical protein